MREAIIKSQRFIRQSLYKILKPRIINLRGIRLATGDHIQPYQAVWIYSGDYERGESKIVRKFLEPDDVVLELGTGLGFIAMLCARKIGADRVHTFEANPAMEPRILENFRLNNLFPHLQICMLGVEAGEVEFYQDPEFCKSSSLRPDGDARVTRTAVRPLNDEIRRIRPTFLIIDIEGGESEIFQILDDFGDVRKVAIEVHPHLIGQEKVDFIRQRLVDAGFVIDPRYSKGQQLFATRPGARRGGDTREPNS